MALNCLFKNISRLQHHHVLSGSQIPQWVKLTGNQRWMSNLTQQFDAAKERLGKLAEDPGNEAKLKIYGLFKQSTVGPVNNKRPGMMDFVGRAKWDAWNSLGPMSADEAKQAYIDYINSLVGEQEAEATAQVGEESKYNCIQVSNNEGLTIIRLNRPKKKNAITYEMYSEWADALAEAAADKKTVVCAITGNGDYFCSGNDLSNFMNIPADGLQKMAEDGANVLEKFVRAFIEFPKPLIGVVNGPAVGVSVTTMALYDLVYSTDRATFHTPFSALGQSPEGCSSYTFPKLMGSSLASEMLLFNKKMTAYEAKDAKLIGEVFPDSTFEQEVWPRIQAYAKLPVNCLVYSKALHREREKALLLEVMESENNRLKERWLSDDCMNAIMNFFSSKKS